MDDVERAYKAAASRYLALTWEWLAPRERTEAIYTEMRRLDAEDMANAQRVGRLMRGGAEVH